jgi:hypothetical protein
MSNVDSTCIHTMLLNRYMAELDREAAYEEALATYSTEIASNLMDVGYCKVQFGLRITTIDWTDFLLMVDEQDAWGRLEQDKKELFTKFCDDYAKYRLAYMED